MASVKLKSMLFMSALGLSVCGAMEDGGGLFDDGFINNIPWGISNDGGLTVSDENTLIEMSDGMMDLDQLDIEPVEISIGTTTREAKKAESKFRAIYFSEVAEKGIVELQKKILEKLEPEGYTINYVDGCTPNELCEKTIEFQGDIINVGISTRNNKNSELEVKKFHCSLDVLKSIEDDFKCDKRQAKIMEEWNKLLLHDNMRLKKVSQFKSFIVVEIEGKAYSKLFNKYLSQQKSHISLFKIKTQEEKIQEKLEPFMQLIEDQAKKSSFLGNRDTNIPSWFFDIYEKITGDRNLPKERDQKQLLIKLKECAPKPIDARSRIYKEVFKDLISSLYNNKRKIISYDSINDNLGHIDLEPNVSVLLNKSNGMIQFVAGNSQSEQMEQNILVPSDIPTVIDNALTVDEVKTLLEQNTSLEVLELLAPTNVIEEAKIKLREEEAFKFLTPVFEESVKTVNNMSH